MNKHQIRLDQITQLMFKYFPDLGVQGEVEKLHWISVMMKEIAPDPFASLDAVEIALQNLSIREEECMKAKELVLGEKRK